MTARRKILVRAAAAALLGIALTACRVAPVVTDRLAEIQPIYPDVFFLQFDHTGKLLNLTELERLTRRLRESDDVDRVVVLSFGWNSAIDDISQCTQYISAYRDARGGPDPEESRSVVVCVLCGCRQGN